MNPNRKPARSLRPGWCVAAVAALALVAAACAGSGARSSGAYGVGARPSSSTPAATLVEVRGSRLGQLLVDGQGRTLYLFEADKAGMSSCNGACASAWPPYLSDAAPRAGAGVTGSLLGTSARGDDGGTQVVYDGHPLYYYAGDSEPGDTAGQGLDQFGARWYVLAPGGDKIAG